MATIFKAVFSKMKFAIRLNFVVVIIGSFILTGCGETRPKIGQDIFNACLLFDNPDQSRVGVLMIISAAKNDPSIVERGRGNPHRFIDATVRKSIFPDVVDSKEATYLRETFANALDDFADAYLGNDVKLQKITSSNLTKVGDKLRKRCQNFGMDYKQFSHN